MVLLGVPASISAQDAGPGVSAQDDLFSPRTIRISAGTSLTWSNDGGEQHTVTSDDGSTFDSGTLDPGDTFGFTFETPGSYPYSCAIHGGPGGIGMSGVVVVS
jgi:plastocyanin